MSKKLGKLANRYARALLKAAQRDSSEIPIQQLAIAFKEFANLWQNNHELNATIINPMFEKEQRLKALIEIARQQGLPEILLRFLSILFEKDRIAGLPEIADTFVLLADEVAGVIQVEVTTAHALSGEQTGELEQRLYQNISGKLSFSFDVDQSLIGGLIVRVGGKVFDGSLNGRLQRVERRLRGEF